MALEGCRECGKEISTEASACPHCGAPAMDGPSGECLGCGELIRTTVIGPVCPQCGVKDPLTPMYRGSSALESPTVNRSATIGWAGCAMLCLGAFAPLVSLPIVGTQTYIQNGQGDGLIILALAVVAGIMLATDRSQHTWIPGTLAGLTMAFTYITLTDGLNQARADMERELAGNPLAGIGELALQPVQMQWGWAVLALGAGALLASAVVARR